MELKNNTVWVLKGNDCFAIFSSKEYAEKYKKSLIEIWEKSMIRDTIPPRLNNRSEIEKYGKEYSEVIKIDKDHYQLIRSCISNRDGHHSHWQYDLFSNKDWDEYYEDFVSDYVIEDYTIFK
jgi:hypothetical protein